MHANEILTQFEAVVETFRTRLVEDQGVSIKDEKLLAQIVLKELVSLVDQGITTDLESGCDLHELYGEEIYDAIEFVDEDDGQPDEAQEWHDFDPDC